MERIQAVSVGSSQISGQSSAPSTGGLMLHSTCSKKSEGGEDGTAFYERFVLDVDSSWAELNRHISSDAHIGNRFQTSPLLPEHSLTNEEAEMASLFSHHGFSDSSAGVRCVEELDRLSSAVEEQLQQLKKDIEHSKNFLTMFAGENLVQVDERFDGLRKLLKSGFQQIKEMFVFINASASELQWEHELQEEISHIVFQDCIRNFRDEFELQLYKQQNLMETLNTSWQEKVDELEGMRGELDGISKSLLNTEQALQHWHARNESSEDRGIVRWKDNFYGKELEEILPNLLPPRKEEHGNFVMENSELLHLKHMTHEETMAYFRSEMTKMRRQHDLALQEKTEELFKLKREFLKGSLAFRKDKEFEFLRNKISEVILKLDEISIKDIKVPAINNDHDEIFRLKVQIDSLYYENQRLRGLLVDKRKEAKQPSFQLSHAANKMSLHPSFEAKRLRQIETIKDKYEELQVEVDTRDQVYQMILKEIIDDKHMCAIHSSSRVLTSDAERTCLQATLFEKEKELQVANEENQKLKQAVLAFLAPVNGKEKYAIETMSKLFNSFDYEICIPRGRSTMQLIHMDINAESDSLRSKLDEACGNICQCEMQVRRLNEILQTVSNALSEAEKKSSLLQCVIEENQKSLLASVIKEKEQEKQLEHIAVSMVELSKRFSEIEDNLENNIKRYENRLKSLSNQCNPLMQQAILLKEKGPRHKQAPLIRHSELQKVEGQVDFLGVEADNPSSLLEKMYISVDNYSPVFQHHPGLLDAFLRTCKLSASLRSNQNRSRRDIKQTKRAR